MVAKQVARDIDGKGARRARHAASGGNPLRRRAEGVTRGSAGFPENASLAIQAQGWVFPTGIMTHVLLVAGLRNPTVRRRYEAARDLLADHDGLDLHDRLLELLGSE